MALLREWRICGDFDEARQDRNTDVRENVAVVGLVSTRFGMKEGSANLSRPLMPWKARRQLRAGSTAAANRKRPSSTGRWHTLSRRFVRATKNGFSQPLATFERSYKIRYTNFWIVVSSIEVSPGRGAQNVDTSFW